MNVFRIFTQICYFDARINEDYLLKTINLLLSIISLLLYMQLIVNYTVFGV